MNEEIYYESSIESDAQIRAAGAKKQKVKKALRLMADLADFLEDEKMYLSCGGCNDHAVLCADAGGVILGYQRTPIWQGGDFNHREKGGIFYEETNVNAGDFIEANAHGQATPSEDNT